LRLIRSGVKKLIAGETIGGKRRKKGGYQTSIQGGKSRGPWRRKLTTKKRQKNRFLKREISVNRLHSKE